jgi:DNA-binding winged helix-turn-helix (wHTH) protein/tetratricopeptide (TPR) repeat protein
VQPSVDPSRRLARFGVFEADLASGELRKQGRITRLQQQPFIILAALLERPGELVTRDELRRRLWRGDVNVGFDQILNKGVTKLRAALGDSAGSPRFVETLQRRGYRFIAPVTYAPAPGTAAGATDPVQAAAAEPEVSSPATPTPASPTELRLPSRPASRHRTWRSVPFWWPAAASLVVGAAVLVPTGTLPVALISRSNATPVATNAPHARDLHLRGRYALSRRTEDGLRQSVGFFEEALRIAPGYAPAYVGLADAYSLLASYGVMDPREAMPKAREAATHALTLDSGLAEAHASLGRTAMIFDWDWEATERHFKRALELNPRSAQAHQWYAYLLTMLGRHDEAIDSANHALTLDPVSLIANTAVGYVLYSARRNDEAIAQLERTVKLDGHFVQARRDLALAYLQHGRVADALREFETAAELSSRSPASLADVAYGRAVAGEIHAARAMLADLLRPEAEYVPPDAVAMVYMGLGDHATAIAWLERASEERVSTVPHLAADPAWDPLRKDPAFMRLLASLRVDPAPLRLTRH